MDHTLSLLDIYNNAFGAERKRLSTILENDYLNFVDETQHRDAKKKFFIDMQTEFNSRYHLGLDGFVFGLVRFESYFDDEMKLFRKKPVEMNFDKAKEKFLTSWTNESRRKYIVNFFENPTELILQELGKLNAWKELGYNSFGTPNESYPFIDEIPEEKIVLDKIVLEMNYNNGISNELADTSEVVKHSDKPTDNEVTNLMCIDTLDDRIKLLYNFLVGNKIIEKMLEATFIAHFQGQKVEPKINIKVSLKYLVWLLDNLYFMLPPTSSVYKENYYSISSLLVIEHFLLKGNLISKDNLYNARVTCRNVTSLEDKSYFIYEQIIKELKNHKNTTMT